ncbi:hypothetical protein QCD79_13775, partial [Pseudomonas quasicaspiana]|nr:hypothetical protein [Pseudomonas quasicaspiana]
ACPRLGLQIIAGKHRSHMGSPGLTLALLRIRRRTRSRLLTLFIHLLVLLANLPGIFRFVVEVFAVRFLILVLLGHHGISCCLWAGLWSLEIGQHSTRKIRNIFRIDRI